MILRTNVMSKDQIEELGMEFWGILSFEANLKGLFSFLQLEKLSISMKTFINWVVFPENIPSDIRSTIRKSLLNRHTYNEYEQLKNVKMSGEEEKLHAYANELIHFKYHNKVASPQRFHHLYLLSENAFTNILNFFQEYDYVDKETCFKLYLHYVSLKRGEEA